MTFEELLSIVGAVLLSLGGGAAIVLGFSKYLGGIIAARILEKEKAAHVREQELLVRRRNIYPKLALTLRIFLQSGGKATTEEQAAFLAAYDEAALEAAAHVERSMLSGMTEAHED